MSEPVPAVSTPRLRAVLCADWSKDPRRREVYLADVQQREVRRLAGSWTAAAVIDAAREVAGDGAALAGFDAPLGVPASYWEKLRQAPGFPKGVANFAAWLPETRKQPQWFDNAPTPWDWRVEHPFFAVAPGAGGRRIWEDTLRRAGVETLRRIDQETAAKPVFITSGIPGTPGSAARQLWREFSFLCSEGEGPPFALWPFHGSLDALLASHTVTVAEIYPRVAYALALSPEEAATRRPLKIAKTDRGVRQDALADLEAQPWLGEHGVRLADLGAATDSDDAFDALLSAAGLLRCVLEGTPLAPDALVDPVAEGGILGTGALDLSLGETTYTPRPKKPPRKRASRRRVPPPDFKPRLAGAPRPPPPPPEPEFQCPIPGCDHVFTGSRAGWDAHVASVRIHPRWHPDVRDPAERKALFKDSFKSFWL